MTAQSSSAVRHHSVDSPANEASSTIGDQLIRIDHVAVAVENLQVAERWYTEVLGFRCIERRVLEGRKSGMISAVMQAGPVVFVLVQGTNPESRVSRYVRHFGHGVHHVALQVRGIDRLVPSLRGRRLDFSTTLVESPGLRQAFARRSAETGLMLEFVERGEFAGFSDQNVQSLFAQLEASDDF